MKEKVNMKAVILAGGRGSRLSEFTHSIPKPLVPINGKPIIMHIIEHLINYGIKDYIICTGYLENQIKDYFINFKNHNSDFEINLSTNKINYLNKPNLNISVSCIFTGNKNQTGSRIKKIEKFLDGRFLMTYGDGISDVNINELIKSHSKSKKLVTMTAVPTPGRWGNINIKKNKVINFSEKPTQTTDYINGGFFIIEPKVLKFIKDRNNIRWEKEVMEIIKKKKQLNAYVHKKFWKAIDTINDKEQVEKLLKDKK